MAIKIQYGRALAKLPWLEVAALARSMPNDFIGICPFTALGHDLTTSAVVPHSALNNSLLWLTPWGGFLVRPRIASYSPKNTGICRSIGRQPPSGLTLCSL